MKVNNFNFINQYINNLQKTLKSVDQVKLIKGKFNLKKNKRKKEYLYLWQWKFISISNHLLCDFNKGIKYSSKRKILKPRVIGFHQF